MSTLGNNIKELRDKENISQKDFAKKLGVSNVVLSRYESGERKPDYDTLDKIADYFGVSTDYLLGRSSDPLLTKEDDEKGETRLDKIAAMIEEIPEKDRDLLWEKLEAYVTGMTHAKKNDD